MPGMRLQKLDMWVRLSAGCGLIILVSAQQKLCPWLFSAPLEQPPVPPVVDDARTAANRATDQGHRDTPPPRLPYLLQGATTATPRAATHWSPTSYRATTGWRDGVRAASLSVPSGSAQASVLATRLAWPHATDLPSGLRPTGPAPLVGPQTLMGVALFPTGPPA